MSHDTREATIIANLRNYARNQSEANDLKIPLTEEAIEALAVETVTILKEKIRKAQAVAVLKGEVVVDEMTLKQASEIMKNNIDHILPVIWN